MAVEVLRNFSKTEPAIANSFYQQYLLPMLGDVFYVLTDADHKSGKWRDCFDEHSLTLHTIRLQAPSYAALSTDQPGGDQSGRSTSVGPGCGYRSQHDEPLVLEATHRHPVTERIWTRTTVSSHVGHGVRGLTDCSRSAQINSFVHLMAESSGDFERFKLILRDFLISIKEFSATDNADLYIADKEAELEAKQKEEKEAAMRVPGMLKPSQIDDDAEL